MKLTTAQLARMNRLLEEAVDLDEAGRKKWLEALSPQDKDLKDDLHQGLLPLSTLGIEPLPARALAAAHTRSDATALMAGNRVGPYLLMRQLGRGGMADVWLARRNDAALQREVALKLPRLSHFRADLAIRFRRERDILAAMEHPYIARMYDAGISAEGLPYLAMEYVRGEHLIDGCDARRIGLQERLQLFQQVLDAVQYAHGRQVIHRDLKPSNILVTDRGQVRLLDFGVASLLARADEEAELSQQYGRAFTPEYASPELMQGADADAAADVYSLGVVLYELLCGSRPYRLNASAPLGLLKQALAAEEAEPPSARLAPGAGTARNTTQAALARQLRGNLDAIVLKALARRPEERYRSTAALADELERHLGDRPIEAWGNRFLDRLRRFVLSRRSGIPSVPGNKAQRLLRTRLGRRADAPDARGPLRVPFAACGNVPHQLHTLIGRDDELLALADLVGCHPLVTIVGAAGLGKTSLALAAAQAMRERWPDGAWVVELANVADSVQISLAVAQALGVTLSGSVDPQIQLVRALQAQTLLLVLDNCEHVIEAARALADAIAAGAPSVRLLATSRELLNVQHENPFQLAPLAFPAADEPADPDRFSALRLFAERARAVDPRFMLSSANAEVVAEICRHLDGLPLAIELAAARVRLLGVQGVRDRLGERFRVLAAEARTTLARHQTLRAAMDWSHELLSIEQQTVLRRLGIFVGGFTLELAQQVARDERIDPWTVLDALGALVNKSLVVVDTAEWPRYRLLETTRAYALEKLAELGETARLLERHARAVCDVFVRTEEARFGEDGTLNWHQFRQWLAPELDNARSAIQWAMGDPSHASMAIRLAGAAGEAFRLLNRSPDLLRLMQALQDRVDAERDPVQAALFWSELSNLGSNGRLPKKVVTAAASRAERIYRERGLRRRLYMSLFAKAWAQNAVGEHVAAETTVAQMLALEDPAWPGWVRGLRLGVHGAICMQLERFEDAARLHGEQRTLLERETGETERLRGCLSNLSNDLLCLQRDEEVVATGLIILELDSGQPISSDPYAQSHMMAALVFLGRLEEADRIMRRSISLLRRGGLLFFFASHLAMLLAEQGRCADAARVDGAAIAYVRRSGIAYYPVFRRARAWMQRRFDEAGLAPAAIERWRLEGEGMDEAALAAVCLGDRESTYSRH